VIIGSLANAAIEYAQATFDFPPAGIVDVALR
jgi:hypothetical protein